MQGDCSKIHASLVLAWRE